MKAQIVAKQDGVIAGLELCKAAFRLTGRETVFTKKISDGTKIKKICRRNWMVSYYTNCYCLFYHALVFNVFY